MKIEFKQKIKINNVTGQCFVTMPKKVKLTHVIGGGCNSFDLDKAMFKARRAGMPLVFGLDELPNYVAVDASNFLATVVVDLAVAVEHAEAPTK